MNNIEWCKYTYMHRKAFDYCVRRLIHEPSLRAEMLRRSKVHDMDKMVMYLNMDQKTAQETHVKTQPHHLENNLPRTYLDYIETVIDYECAPYTKPDKPLNAFDFVNLLTDYGLLDENTVKILAGIMDELGIANSHSYVDDTEGQEYIAGLPEVTEEMIEKEIEEYLASDTNKTANQSIKNSK